MASIEIAGTAAGVETDREAAAEFLRSWHLALPETAGGGRRLMCIFSLPSARSLFIPAAEAVAAIERQGLDGLVWPEDGSGGQQVYHQATVLLRRPERGRGRKTDADAAPGFWMDLDAGKPGAFADRDAALDWVWSLDRRGLGPGIVVGSGGGLHLYWRTPGPLGALAAAEWCERIRLWGQQDAGVSIDSVSEPNRVLRLPGTLWFPKDAGSGSGAGMPRPVTLLRCARGAVADREALEAATASAWRERLEARAEAERLRREGEAETLSAWDPADLGVTGEPGGWQMRWAVAEGRRAFDAQVGWEQILEPAGWRKWGVPDSEGRQQWTRPGSGARNPRSMVTGWVGSPGVAKLLSESEETGLLRLVRAGIPLTRSNVAAELYCGGNVAELIVRYIKKASGGAR
jgi:hypothetical protein